MSGVVDRLEAGIIRVQEDGQFLQGIVLGRLRLGFVPGDLVLQGEWNALVKHGDAIYPRERRRGRAYEG